MNLCRPAARFVRKVLKQLLTRRVDFILRAACEGDLRCLHKPHREYRGLN